MIIKMKYKQIVYTPFILIITSLKLIASVEESNEIREISQKYNHSSKLERIVAIWNKSSEMSNENTSSKENKPEEIFERPDSALNVPSEINKCIESHQYQIIENFTQGKKIILNCFKAVLILKILKYLEEPSKNSIRLFNGLLELKKIPEKVTSECSDEHCDKKYNRNFKTFDKRKKEYIGMYKRAMQKLINERNRINSYRNQTEEERVNQLNRINKNSKAFLSEVIRNLGNEDVEKTEEEMLKKEITDPRLLSVLDALTKDYMVKFKFYPGVSARMMRSNGGFTFDLEIQNSEETSEEESLMDESSTREIKDWPQAKDYLYDVDDIGVNTIKRKNKINKKKKKEIKKKQKKLKKMIPYLLLPMLIQVTLLPFVFKKLFFLAMKALFAGKVALILVGFNLLRNTCIKDEDYNQKIRVEHYGYRRGEEYGAWINGRSFEEPSLKTAMSEEPYRAHKPVS